MAQSKDTQQKLYEMLEALQTMVKELPDEYQMRMPVELLASLANTLLNEAIFEIANGLSDIQHVTEKHLMHQRLQLLSRQKTCMKNAMEETNSLHHPQLIQSVITSQEMEREAVAIKHREELKQHDMRLILQLDQKVSEQQTALEKAGVPGFYASTNPQEVQSQMYLLGFIQRLSEKYGPSQTSF
nr:EOG090X0GJG [Artemia franciscana]